MPQLTCGDWDLCAGGGAIPGFPAMPDIPGGKAADVDVGGVAEEGGGAMPEGPPLEDGIGSGAPGGAPICCPFC